MDPDYVAWNGERYVWPPPEGWYLASDGRWWAPDTGPDMDFDPLPAESVAAESGAGFQAEPVDNAGAVDDVPTGPDPGLAASQDVHGHAAASQVVPDAHPEPGLEADHARGPELDSTTAQTEFGEPGSGRPVSGQVDAVYDTDTTAAVAADDADSRRSPTMVMAEPSRTATGPHPEVAPDPDTGRHDQVPILEPTEEVPSAGIRRSRTMPMVAGVLLAAAAIGLAALLALLSGDNETQTQQPSASADEAEGDPNELVVSTDDSGTATSTDGSMEGATDDAMDNGAMDDTMSEDDAMTEGSDQATSTTAANGGGSDNAALIGQFRTLLEDNQITAAALTGDDLAVFGQTACSYATSAEDLPEYEQIRNEALNGAQNDELSIEELQFVVDGAVTVFCAEDATRLGLTATAPATEG